VTGRILRHDGDGVLGANGCGLAQDAIADGALDVFDFLDSFLFVKAIDEKINIRSRSKNLVIVVAKSTLGLIVR
jgi:hypothetical protein